ncbi:arginyl-tRNA--protein transferase 1-like [Ochlerotatus camptorhynchus]|uniref:arginyl-tRNA--protein transferase 1-like n=1 Tax=Ochlerotatus camptorhynchus TaxID=644619 RepID=UPI0031CE5952
MKPAFIIIFLCMVHIIAAKPFLENLLLQVATSLSSSTPDDPQSHVSDFRAQPKANSRSDRYEVDSTDEGKNNTTTEQTDTLPSTGILWNSNGFRLFPWLRSNNVTEMYSDIIGNIIGSARERITVAFQRLLSPLQRHRQQPHHQEQQHRSDFGSNEIDAASANLMNSLIKNETSKTNSSNVATDVNGESKLFVNASEIQSEKMDHEPVIKETVISSDAPCQTKNNNNQVETTSEFVGLALPIEESNQPKVSFQLDNDYAFETNESVIGPIQPEKGFLAKRLEHISKRLNETRNQFRARTIQAVSSLVPLVHLVTERRGRKIVNSLETATTNGSLENYSTAKNNEENNFPLPPHLSRLSSNLLALHPRSKERRAALVFQNAFNKYAQLVINGRNASTGDGNSISNTIEQKEGNDNYSTDDAGGANIAGEDVDDGDDDDEDDDDEYENKDDIAGSIGNGTGEEVIDNNVSSRASYISATKRMNMQSVATVGILILEVFGSIAGLTWGAFNQLQLLFP